MLLFLFYKISISYLAFFPEECDIFICSFFTSPLIWQFSTFSYSNRSLLKFIPTQKKQVSYIPWLSTCAPKHCSIMTSWTWSFLLSSQKCCKVSKNYFHLIDREQMKKKMQIQIACRYLTVELCTESYFFYQSFVSILIIRDSSDFE